MRGSFPMAGRGAAAPVDARTGRAGQCDLSAQRQVPPAPAQTRGRRPWLADGFHAPLAVRSAGQPSPGPLPAAARLLRRRPGFVASDTATRLDRPLYGRYGSTEAGAKPPKAILKPYTRHILGIDSGVQSHHKATTRPPQGYHKATTRLPQGHTEVIADGQLQIPEATRGSLWTVDGRSPRAWESQRDALRRQVAEVRLLRRGREGEVPDGLVHFAAKGLLPDFARGGPTTHLHSHFD